MCKVQNIHVPVQTCTSIWVNVLMMCKIYEVQTTICNNYYSLLGALFNLLLCPSTTPVSNEFGAFSY